MLTVHVGLHKTGSTSIQAVLGLERGHIRRRQVYLRWNDLFVTDGAIETRHVDRIIDLSCRGWHVIVSSEGALGPMVEAYPRAAEVAEELSRLFADIPLRMVAYLRPHHEWAASALGQLRAEGRGLDPDGFASGLLSARNFRHTTLVGDLTDALPAGCLAIRPYTSQMDVVGDFFAHCDLGEVPPQYSGLRANPSEPARAVASPFSRQVQQDLIRHFHADWTALATGDLPAARMVRGDLWQLLEGDVAPAASDVPLPSPSHEGSSEAPRSEQREGSHLLRAAQASAWTVRHGPRLAVLDYLVARDAFLMRRKGTRNRPTARPVVAGTPRSRS